MLYIKKIEVELSDKSIVVIDEQLEGVSLKQLSDIIVKAIFTSKLQRNQENGTEFAQRDTAREIGKKSISTIYRAIRR